MNPKEILFFITAAVPTITPSETSSSAAVPASSSSDTPTPINTRAVIGGTLSGAIALMGLVTLLFGFLIYNIGRKRKKYAELCCERYVVRIGFNSNL